MKNSIAAALSLLLITSCRQTSRPIVSPAYTDSLLGNYRPSINRLSADSNLAFWQQRMQELPDNFVNGPKYASTLSAHFHSSGNIRDLLKADSLMRRSNEANGEKEASLFRTLASYALLQHRFQQADSFLKIAVQLDGRNIANTYLDFDVSFETGQYTKSKSILNSLALDKSYAYYFRKSKLEHYDGSLDSSISYMMKAAVKAANNKYLQQTALSNTADLAVHKADLAAACQLYKQSIAIDASDLHSIMGLGWIALVHDKNDVLAEKIFRFVQQHSLAPDALLKLVMVAEARDDSAQQLKYARQFEEQTPDSLYGSMYHKYLIDLYTGILHDPAKAVLLSVAETKSRPTPQVFAWYAWSLYCDNQQEKAYQVFKTFVSQKPLEGLELYYMGKMMQGMDKGYNAQQFFKAAYKNRYDLSPAKVKDLAANLE